MSNEKQFAVWMDLHHATILGKTEAGEFTVIEHVKGEATTQNSSEKNAHNHERMAQAKFFKEITSHMQNATDIHLTGTGTAQEQFIKYLADTPQFKNTKTAESTSNKMSDERLIEFISGKMN